MRCAKRKIATVAIAAVLGGAAAGAMAGGLGIGTQSGSGTGNAFSGGAAAGEDASVVWYNPAAMSRLPGRTNFAVAGHLLRPSFKFQNTGSTLAPGAGEGGDGGGWHLIPQGFGTYKLNESWSVGAAFNTPFGLETEYDRGWRGQGVALQSALKTYNLGVAASYRLNDMISIGAGLNYQRAELKFNSQTVIGFIEPKLSDNGTGWNVGVLFQPTAHTRVGAHYRSAINYNTTGTLIAPAAAGGSSLASAGITTPDSLSFSVFHALNPRWDVMGDITWTGWDHVKRLNVVRTSGPLAGTVPVFITFNWDDTLRYSIGANYRVNDQWKIRLGLAFDETPSNNVDRTARLPDEDRRWVAIGAQWRMTRSGLLDIGYAHEFIKDSTVRNTALGGGTLVGHFKNQADILSVQYSHSF